MSVVDDNLQASTPDERPLVDATGREWTVYYQLKLPVELYRALSDPCTEALETGLGEIRAGLTDRQKAELRKSRSERYRGEDLKGVRL